MFIYYENVIVWLQNVTTIRFEFEQSMALKCSALVEENVTLLSKNTLTEVNMNATCQYMCQFWNDCDIWVKELRIALSVMSAVMFVITFILKKLTLWQVVAL